MTPIAKIIITPLSRETIARMTISAIASPVSAFKRIVVSALLMLMMTSMQAQNVGDFLVNEKIASTGRVTLRSWPKGANTLWGTDANSLPQKITLGAGLTLSGTTLNAAGAAGSVSSVSASGGSTGLTYTGGPITSSGTLTLGGTLAIANGGTGGTSIAGARSGLNLVPGVHVQSYSLMLTRLAGLSVSAGASGSVTGDFVMGQGNNAGSANAGAAGGIYITSGSAYDNVYNGGNAGSLRMVGSDAGSDYEGRVAGSIDTSAFGPYRGGNILTAALDGTGRDGGSIDTSAGGSLIMSGFDVTGPTVSGTILTVDGSGAALTDLNAESITTGTINADRIPSAMSGKSFSGILSLGLSDGATKDASFSADNLSFTDNDSGQLISVSTPATGSQIFLTWPSSSGILLTNNSSLPAASLTGTIASARLPTTITGLTSVTSTTFVGDLTGTATGNATVAANTFTGSQNIVNTTAALNGTQRVSPDLILEGRGWATTGSQSQSVRVRQNVLPVQGAAPTANWRVQADINAAGTWPTILQVTSGGVISTTGTNTLTLGTDPRLFQGATARPLELATTLGAVTIVDGGANGQRLAFSSTAGNTSPTTQFVSIASAAISQRSGTTAQSFSVAKTWTSATNWEHGVMDWQTTADVLRIGSDKGSGGGSNREVRIIMGGTPKITLDTAGNVIVSGLPTSAPATSGALWRDAANGNVLKVVP
jgi:hypothetical protein